MKIVFEFRDRPPMVVEAQPGGSLMELAKRHLVPGIDADCGGGCSCATCHVQVRAEWLGILNQISIMERDVLEFLESRTEESRLACQISLTEDLDGLTVLVVGRDY